MKLEVARAAVIELRVAAKWYETQREGLGDAFLEAIDRTVIAIVTRPRAFALWRGSRAARLAVVKRFPYVIIFTIRNAETGARPRLRSHATPSWLLEEAALAMAFRSRRRDGQPGWALAKAALTIAAGQNAARVGFVKHLGSGISRDAFAAEVSDDVLVALVPRADAPAGVDERAVHEADVIARVAVLAGKEVFRVDKADASSDEPVCSRSERLRFG